MKIAVIGAGAMGGAFVTGLLNTDVCKPADITVSAAHQSTIDKFIAKGVIGTLTNTKAIKSADIIVLAVKPWLIESVVNEIRDTVDYSAQTVISFAAGIKYEQLKSYFDKPNNAITSSRTNSKGMQNSTILTLFTVIPNTAIEQKQSMTFIVPVNATDAHTEQVKTIFAQLGDTIVTDEAHISAGTSLASCGIAFAMRYIRASIEGGVELGFKAKDAQQIVLQTVKGAVELLQSSGNHPEAEIDKVTTPGGLTIKGLNEMEYSGFTSAVIKGLKASLPK